MADLDQNIGVGDIPDNSGSAAAPELETSALEVEAPASEEQIISAEAAPEGGAEEEVSEELSSEMESAIKSEPTDTDLVKKLRNLVKMKYEDYSSRQPATPQMSEENAQLLDGLFEFDAESGTPTTKKFAESLAKRDVSLAEQALIDLSTVPVNEQGYTLGHKFLEIIGLDPYKIEELKQFSRGEIDVTSRGMIVVPDKVPKEYAEAYKSLDEVTRVDVDLYLEGEREDQRMAALRTLRDRHNSIQNERQREEFQTQQATRFESEVAQDTEVALDTTYTGVLSSLKANPAYTNVAISSDKAVDTMVKDSIISNLNALGDPRSVLAKQAVKAFEAQGVKVDTEKISTLMQVIESSTKTAIAAEKKGKLQNRDYSVQVREAKAKATTAVTQLVALGNKYFGQTLASLSGVKPNTPAPKPGLPDLSGKAPEGNSTAPKAMKMSELDASIMEIAKGLQAAG